MCWQLLYQCLQRVIYDQNNCENTQDAEKKGSNLVNEVPATAGGLLIVITDQTARDKNAQIWSFVA